MMPELLHDLWRRLFHPHAPVPPPPDVRLSTDEERNRIEERQRDITARLERLRLEAERPALRRRMYER